MGITQVGEKIVSLQNSDVIGDAKPISKRYIKHQLSAPEVHRIFEASRNVAAIYIYIKPMIPRAGVFDGWSCL